MCSSPAQKGSSHTRSTRWYTKSRLAMSDCFAAESPPDPATVRKMHGNLQSFVQVVTDDDHGGMMEANLISTQNQPV